MLASKQMLSTAEFQAEDVARLRAALGRMARRLRPTRAAAGLTPTQISVLLAVVRCSPQRLADLAEREGLNPTMLSRVVANLAQAGLVRRAADPADRRAALVEATPAGKKLRERMRRERNDLLAVELAALGEAEREALLAAPPPFEALAERPPRRAGRGS